MAAIKKTTISYFVRMERIVLQSHDVEYRTKRGIEDIVCSIDDGSYLKTPGNSFYFEPDSIMGKLDIEQSPCFIDEGENAELLEKNVHLFLEGKLPSMID